jgi:pSer/pThr/pTyr-binding forkhead associated (FHA) protein
MRRRFVWATLSLLALILALPAIALAQGGIADIYIWDTSAENFPQVQVTFRAVDPDGVVMGNLLPDDFSVYDNETAIPTFELESRDDGPIHVIFLIDEGRYANYRAFGMDELRGVMTYFVEGSYFREGVDTVEVLAQTSDGSGERTVVLLDQTQSAEAFTDFVNSTEFTAGFGPTQALGGVETALDRVVEQVDTERTAVNIVLITPFIDTLVVGDAVQVARGVARAAHEQMVTIYTLHTHLQGQLPDPLQTLANESGGRYLLLKPDQDQRQDLDGIYGDMMRQRAYYTLSYESPVLEPGEHTVAVVPRGLGPDAAPEVGSYNAPEIAVEPPAVSIASPAAGETIDVAVEQPEDGPPVIVPDTVTVDAQVEWPGGEPRAIEMAELIVDGEVVFTTSVSPGSDAFGLVWEVPFPSAVAGEAEAPPAESHTLQVRVIDEGGMVAESDPVTVNLAVAQPVKEEAGEGFVAGCLANPFQGACLAVVVLPPALIVGLLLVGGVVVLIRRRGKREVEAPPPAAWERPAPARSAGPGDTGRTVLEWDEGAPSAGPQPLAMLRVLDGPSGRVGEVIDVKDEVTTFGRSPEAANVAFYAGERASISALHCTLQMFRGRFFITDNSSTNGTFVDGEELLPGQPYELHDGAEIVLGQTELKGVRMRFDLGSVPPSQSAAGATRVEGDPYDEGPGGGATMIEQDGLDDFDPGGRKDDDSWMNKLG